MKRVSHEELLIDYLENDLEAPLKEDLARVLKNSVDDQKFLKSLENTKAIVKATNTIRMSENDAFFAQLESKIMVRLDDVIPEPAPAPVITFVRRERMRWVASVAAAVLVIVVGAAVWNQIKPGGRSLQGTQVSVIPGDLLISTSASDLDSFSDSLMNHRNDNDFYMDMAAQRIDSLSQIEANSVFDRLAE